MAGNGLLRDALILSAVSHEAKKQEKAAEKEQKQKERDPLSPVGKSPEYVLALAIATGNMEGLSPDQIAYVNEERRRIAQEKAEQDEKERLEREAKKAEKAAAKAAAKAEKAEARERAKAEGKPRRFPFFGKNGGGE